MTGCFLDSVGFFEMLFSWDVRAGTTRVAATPRRCYPTLGSVTEQPIVFDLGISISSFTWRGIHLRGKRYGLDCVEGGVSR